MLQNAFRKNVDITNINLLYYYRMDVGEVIDVNRTSASKECIIYHYWYLLDKVSSGCLEWVLWCFNDVYEP